MRSGRLTLPSGFATGDVTSHSAVLWSRASGAGRLVFITGDVHYCAAHHYSPERAVFSDFDPFWEFVAGPINAGSFGPNQMDGTFGPEVVFSKAGATNQSPRDGAGQFFGHVDLDEEDTFTVTLRDANRTTVYTKVLQPER